MTSHDAPSDIPSTAAGPVGPGQGGRPGDRVYPERYYEILARDLGEERARWARLPYEERMRELAWYHAHCNTPDDLSLWPAELDGGVDRP